MFLDYKCEKCGEVIEYWKKDSEEYSDEVEVPCLNGKKKKCKVKRCFIKPPVTSVAEGFHGNAADGYTGGSATYIKSPFSPNSSVFGKYGRTKGVETEHKY